MSDIIGSIFGTSSSTTQRTVPDQVQQAINLQRLIQATNLFSTGALSDFSGAQPDIYSPSDLSNYIGDIARQGVDRVGNTPMTNNLSLDQYLRSFDPVTAEYDAAQRRVNDRTYEDLQGNYNDYNRAIQGIDSDVNAALGRSYSDYGTGINTQNAAYNTATADLDARYNAAIARGDYDLARSLQQNRQNLEAGLSRNYGVANQALGSNEAYANRALGLNEANFLRSLGIAGSDAQSSLARQDANRERALALGLDTTRNYINEIATPALNRSLALQGLERSGAVPAAIARATAETAMPYLQSLEQAYGTNQANTLNSLLTTRAGLGNTLMGLQSGVNSQLLGQQGDVYNTLAQTIQALQGQAMQGDQAAQLAAQQGNQQLGSQRIAQQGNIASNYQNNVAQLAQALMANNITLEQAGIAANSALGQQLITAQNQLRLGRQQASTSLANTYIPQAASFAQSLPDASRALSLLPGQQQALQTANLTALAPLADFSRSLREQDFLRRQGLFTSVYTGLPFQPGSTTNQGQATGNIFNSLGGFFESFGTGGTSGGSGIT